MMKDEEAKGPLPDEKECYSSYLRIAWPSALEAVLVSLIASVDSIMVSGVYKGAMAAVGITTQPKFILLAVILSLNVGVTAIVARRKGEGDRHGANRTLRECLLLSVLLSVVMAVMGHFAAPGIFRFMKAGPDYIKDAILYFSIIMYSLPLTAANLTINAAQRGIGKTKISLTTNVAGNIVNLIMNFLLINGIWFFPKLGVEGVAIATLIGAFASFLLSFFTLLKKDGYLTLRGTSASDFFPDHATMRSIGIVSSSSLVEQCFMRIGFFLFNLIVIRLGTSAYTAHLIAMSILNLSFAFGSGFSIAASALVGHSLGARRPDLAKLYGKTGQRTAFFASCLLCILFLAFRIPILHLFNARGDVLVYGERMLYFVSFITFWQTAQVVISGCLRGAGDTKFVAFTALISVAIVRPLLSLVLCFPLGLGVMGAWFGITLDQFLRWVLYRNRFHKGHWTRIEL